MSFKKSLSLVVVGEQKCWRKLSVNKIFHNFTQFSLIYFHFIFLEKKTIPGHFVSQLKCPFIYIYLYWKTNQYWGRTSLLYMSYEREVQYFQAGLNEITRFWRACETNNDGLKLTGDRQPHWTSDSVLNRMKCGNSSGSNAESLIHADYITAITRIISGTDLADVVRAGILNGSWFGCLCTRLVFSAVCKPRHARTAG